MHWLSDPNAWASLLTLTALEIVLGIDNIIFISILSSRLGTRLEQVRARRLGLAGAFISRLALLFSIVWIMRLNTPLFGIGGFEFTGRDLILLIGGAFLITKATREIHHKLDSDAHEASQIERKRESLWGTVGQIMLLDIVFSLDSVITAVGMAEELVIMVLANVVALAVMLFAMEGITSFVDRRPTVKMLALAFLVLIGTNLVAEGFGQGIPKGYIYTAMAFSLLVELLNGRARDVEERSRLKRGD